jgi:hypothetical protein
VGSDFDCGINADGALICWGYYAPAKGAPIPGPYAEVGVAEHEVCAVRRDTRALECWRRDQSRMVTVMRDKVRSLAFQHDRVCAQIEDGRTFCRGFAANAQWSAIPGAFRVVTASFGVVCGATAPVGRDLRCWEITGRDGGPRTAPDRPPMPTPVDEPTAIAMFGLRRPARSAHPGESSAGDRRCAARGRAFTEVSWAAGRASARSPSTAGWNATREWPFLKP